MFSLKFIRENIEVLEEAARKKGEKVDWEKFEELDNERRRIIAFVEERKRWQKDITEKISSRKDDKEGIEPLIRQARKYSDEIRESEKKLREIEEQLNKIVATIPKLQYFPL